MRDAYIEAVYFTETGDTDQPLCSAQLTPLFKAQAYLQCRDFLWAIADIPGVFDVAGMPQFGHDLWLTRNGHGTGFWDRPELYGEELAVWLTRIAKAMGQHDAEFVEEVAA